MCQKSCDSELSEKAGANQLSAPSAMQCAAVRIKSPFGECNTEPVHVCVVFPPTKTAPIRGSGGTGAAVTTAAGAPLINGDGAKADFACDSGCPLHDVTAAATAAIRTTRERRM